MIALYSVERELNLMMVLSRPMDTIVASVAWSDMSLARASEVLLWKDKINAKIMCFYLIQARMMLKWQAHVHSLTL